MLDYLDGFRTAAHSLALEIKQDGVEYTKNIRKYHASNVIIFGYGCTVSHEWSDGYTDAILSAFGI